MKKRVLIGTTNPSKINRFTEFLEGFPVEIVTLHDLGVTQEPEETGNTPEENALLKARFYSQFCECVICNDSGLYFEELKLEDPRQPGLHIRTPQGIRLDDEQMIDYYAKLIHSLGGRVTACYLDGIAVYCNGCLSSFMPYSEMAQSAAFYMVDTPSPVRRPGWPLDSLSLNCKTQTYFSEQGNDIYETKEQVMVGEYHRRVVQFLKTALQLKD